MVKLTVVFAFVLCLFEIVFCADFLLGELDKLSVIFVVLAVQISHT